MLAIKSPTANKVPTLLQIGNRLVQPSPARFSKKRGVGFPLCSLLESKKIGYISNISTKNH
ncbi:hypothetical protein, partial [Lactobacillus bombicola]|uniref:hypothetical protein n=1 Tax=Lactobacillus bombicola TaxID=1505723 RepID=UPI001AD84BB0